MKTDADVGIEASSAVTTSSTLWYGRWRWRCYRYQQQDKRWHGFVDASGCGAATAMQPLPAAVRTLVRPAASRSLLPAATLLVFVAVEVGEIGRVVRQIEVVRLRQRTRLRRTQMRQLYVPRFLIIRRRQQKPMSQI